MFHFISFALTIGQGKYIYKRGKIKEKSAKNQRILFSIFCGNPVILLILLSPEDKNLSPNQLFLIWYIWSWLIWVSVKILMPLFFISKTQVPDPASRDLWYHQHCYISCKDHWKIRERKSSLIQFNLSFVFKMALDLLKWLKETNFYGRKERNYYKNMNFAQKESSY